MNQIKKEDIIPDTKKMYAGFEKIALGEGIKEIDIRVMIGHVFEIAYLLKLKPDEVSGVFSALGAMVKK